MIRSALVSLRSNLLYAVVATLIAGLVFGQFAGPESKALLQAAVVPVLFVMIYPMMINIDLREIVNIRTHAKLVGLSLVVNFGVAPLLAVGLARLFFAGSVGYAIGLYFIALIPTSGMTAAWTGLAGGDLESALVAMSVNLLAAIVILPVYLSVLIDGSVGFDPAALYQQLAVVIVAPMVAGTATRWRLLRRYDSQEFKQLKPMFGGVSSLGVMLIVFIAMAMRSVSILSDPITSLVTIVPLVLFYAGIMVITAVVGRMLLSTELGISLMYATSMRNLSIAIAIVVASDTLPTEAVLPIALAYIIQPPLGAVYMHYRRDVIDEGRSIRQVFANRG